MAKFKELVNDLGLGKAFLMNEKKFPDDFILSFEEWKEYYSWEFEDGHRYGQDYRDAILSKLYENSSNYEQLNFVRGEFWRQAPEDSVLRKEIFTKLFHFSTTLENYCSIYEQLDKDQKEQALGKIRSMLANDPKVWIKIIKLGRGGELQKIAEKEVMQE